jgi:predicted phosphodiesterase
MAQAKCTDDQFIALWRELKSPKNIAKALGMGERQVFRRRLAIEKRLNIELRSDTAEVTVAKRKIEQTSGHARRGIDLEKGRIIVFSDAHFQPDEVTPAYRALLAILKQFKQEIKAVVANGDIFDGSQASRHQRINWAQTPTVKQELEACQEMMTGIEEAVTKNTELIWTLGNHDARFETFLSNSGITTYEGVVGFSLKDHFPMWKPCWSFWVNEDTCIKHRWKGGWTGGRNNTLNGGVNMITGHTHNMSCMPLTDYNGTRWGVQTGTLANPLGEQFIHYTEDAPVDWRSGFVMLSWENGRMLMPEMILISGEDEYEFRGQLHKL